MEVPHRRDLGPPTPSWCSDLTANGSAAYRHPSSPRSLTWLEVGWSVLPSLSNSPITQACQPPAKKRQSQLSSDPQLPSFLMLPV